MAKQQVVEREEKAKLRFVYVELEGGSTALQETMRTFSQALSRPGPKALPGAQVSTPVTRGNAGEPANASGDALGPLFDQSEEAAEVVTTDGPAGVEQDVPPARTKPKRAVPTPKVANIDFEAAATPLETLCAQKSPSSDAEKCLVIAFWLKHDRKCDGVGMNEVFTCYRRMGWTVPTDPSQPLRDLSRSSRQLLSKVARGKYAINHLGENEVAKMGQGGA